MGNFLEKKYEKEIFKFLLRNCREISQIRLCNHYKNQYKLVALNLMNKLNEQMNRS